MRIRRRTAGRHRRPARAILPAILALGVAVAALVGVTAATAGHVTAMLFHG